MNKGYRQRPRFKNSICIILITFSFIGLPAWTDEKDAQQRKDQEEKAAKIKAQFEYSFNDVSDYLVIIEAKAGMARSMGSGFIARMDGKTYIFTNQHVILGADAIQFKTATGEHLQPQGVELSRKRDIARLPIADRPDALVISDNLAIGIPLAVFGNSEGRGVATELYGKVTGVGADLLEVTADFVSGNSGSPVLNLDREVIGIASYVRYSTPSKMKEGTRFENKVRRFCYRLMDVDWVRVNWRKYNAEYGKLYRDTDATVETVFAIIEEWYRHPYGPVATGIYPDISLNSWASGHNRMVSRITELADKGAASESTVNRINKRIREDIQGSAHALSQVCMRLSVEMEKQSQEAALTGFLRKQFERYSYSLRYASEAIDDFGGELATSNYFRIKY